MPKNCLKVKPSEYCVTAKSQNGDLLLFDVINGNFIKILSKDVSLYKDKILKIIESKSPSSILGKKLYENAFLIDEDEDQERIIEQIYFNTCHDRKCLSITIMPTEQCNFRCVYCYEDFTKGAMSLELQNGLIKFIKREIKNYSGLHISWFGGEPLLEMNIIEHISSNLQNICKKQGKFYTASITTNAYLLNDSYMKKLMAMGIYQYQITVDGFPDIHDVQRPLRNSDKGTFNRIFENLINIKKNVKSGLLRIRLRTNVTSQMSAEYLENFKHYLNKTFEKDPRFEFAFHRAWDPFTERSQKTLFYENAEYRSAIAKADITIMDIHSIAGGGLVCYASKTNSLVVGSDGQVYKCTVALNNPINMIGALMPDGKISFNNKYLFFTYKNASERAFCKGCPVLPACLGENCAMNRFNIEACKHLIQLVKNTMIVSSDAAMVLDGWQEDTI